MVATTGLRTPLTRETIVRAGITLADQAGIELLTMRKLGEALGVEAMSLYNHVANKEDLIDGMIDIVFSEIDLPGSGNWMPTMRRRATSLRGVLMRHRWAVGLMGTRRNPGPANLRHHDAVLGSLRAAGFSVTAAAHAYSLLDSYIYGFAQTQANLPLETPEQIAEVGTELLQQFPVDQYPHLAEMIEHAMKPGYDHEREFEFGLDVVLEGIDRSVQRETRD